MYSFFVKLGTIWVLREKNERIGVIKSVCEKIPYVKGPMDSDLSKMSEIIKTL